MKKFFKTCAYLFGGLFVILYIGFLFVLPHVVKLEQYKPEIQKLVKDFTDLNLEYDNLKIITTPLLEAGIKTDNVKITLPDGSELLSVDGVKAKVFLPSILWLTVKVSGVDVINPKIFADIQDDEQFKAVRLYENLVNRQRKDKLEHPEKYSAQEAEKDDLPIDISKIRINIQNVKLKNYNLVINDEKNSHKLVLKGDEIKLGYDNGETANLKADLHVLSDDSENITANVDIDTSLPKFTPQEKEEDLEAVFAVPFVNPVTTYRTYNLKSDIDSRLKIRMNSKNKNVKAFGHLNIEDTQITMSGLEFPKSHFRFNANDNIINIDSDLYVTEFDDILFNGCFRHGKNPYLNLSIESPKVYFANLFAVVKAYLDTVQIKTDIDNITAGGYFHANADFKTDFETLTSSGAFVVRDGNITDKNIGLVFDDIRANVSLDDNIIKFDGTHLLINGKPLNISGKISQDSVTDLYMSADKLPLMGLYKAFAPKDIKNKYDLLSGFLTVDANATGKIKELVAVVKLNLDDFVIKDKTDLFTASNKLLTLGVGSYDGNIKAKLKNQGFEFSLPLIQSVIKDDNMLVELDNETIKVFPSDVKFNRQSVVNFSGDITNWAKAPVIDFSAGGGINTSDLGILVGEIAIPYFESQGIIPVKAAFNLAKNNMSFVAQAKADNANYFTPVIMKDLENLQTIFQVKAVHKGNTLRVENTGMYTKPNESDFGEDLDANMHNTKNLVNVRAIISNTDIQPFISLFKVDIPQPLEGAVAIFKNSGFNIQAGLSAYGKPESPVLTGKVLAKNIRVPEISSQVDSLLLDLGARNIDINVNRLNLGGTVFRLSARTNWKDIMNRVFEDVNVSSRYIDVNKIVKFGDDVAKAFPNPKEAIEESKDKDLTMNIPLEVKNGHIRFGKIVVDKIYLDNTTSDLALLDNVLYLDNLKTSPLGGSTEGQISMNLVTSDLKAKLSGKDFDVEKILLTVMDMKDMVTGNMNFITDISLSGTDMETQMKTLKGYFDFNIKNGQLGPFGKLENMIMAENIRENAFFSSTIGSLVTNLVTFDTSRYNELYGHLDFLGNGNIEISPIKSQGDVLSMYIAGKMNILDNTAEMKVRGKLASAFADKLGPLANINPVNIVKNTPGLNVGLVKAFALFCEEVSEEEMKALPHLGEGKSDDNATKFQIRLNGNLNKPLGMIKSFKWLVLDSELQAAENFVDTLPIPEAGEEGMTVEELIQLRKEQAEAKAAEEALKAAEEKKLINRVKRRLKISQ
ncbi:AsmA family protein [bacterium]|nr:AsmA family protein [bacterium]